MTDQELEKLLDAGEADRIERKESLGGDAADKIREAICAFANDLPNHQAPGVVLVGVKDKGGFSGWSPTDVHLRTLADMRSDGNILPIPAMIVQKRIIRGTEIGVVIVQPGDAPPFKYKGRVHIRTGPRRGIASAQEERILNEKRRFHDLPYDLHPLNHASVADFSRRLFEEEYLPAAFARDVLAANNRSYEERLAACRMIVAVDDPRPTLTGAIVLAPRARDLVPAAFIQFLRIKGTKLGDPIQDEADIDGPLGQVLAQLDAKLAAHIRTTVDIVSGSVEQRRPDYPLPALQQLARNAVMHRTYEATNTPVRLYWFDDRIEILNPGGPFGLVTKENFGRPGVTDYRNPHISEALKVLGFVQRFGVGIQTAQKLMLENGNPLVKFAVEDTYILATLRRSA